MIRMYIHLCNAFAVIRDCLMSEEIYALAAFMVVFLVLSGFVGYALTWWALP